MQFEICRIPGDGSCLFRALAQGTHQLETGTMLTFRTPPLDDAMQVFLGK